MKVPAGLWLPTAARLFWFLAGLMAGALAIALLPEAGWAIRAVVLAGWLGIVHLLGGVPDPSCTSPSTECPCSTPWRRPNPITSSARAPSAGGSGARFPVPARTICISFGAGMTAARPSDGLTLRIDPYGWPARVLAGLLCVTTAWVPWALAWGDAMSEEVTLPEVSGNTLTLFPGQPNETQLDFGELFPGSDGGDLADYTDLFGNDPAVVNAGQAAQSSLLTEESVTGDAYQGLRESVERPRPDLSNDLLWSQTDEVLDNFEALAASFADCSIQTELSEGERYAHMCRTTAPASALWTTPAPARSATSIQSSWVPAAPSSPAATAACSGPSASPSPPVPATRSLPGPCGS
jgi:hypothetical protein